MRELIARVSDHSGLDEAAAASAVASVLTALRAELSSTEAEALAEALPDELADQVRAGRYDGGGSLAVRVATAEQVTVAEAIERIACVFGALAELLPDATLERLAGALPSELARLLQRRSTGSRPPSHGLRTTTLAEGRPGSRRPLSEARPRQGQPDSVAASDNPHADTKLSSSGGLTQERERESIAEGRPGAHRSLADPRD
jgi:uncharacterized protein (DUF2267 family)